LKSPKVSLPGDWWQIDLVVLPTTAQGNSYIMVILDLFTAFAITRALPSKDAKTVAHALWPIICEWGPPKMIQSDDGSEL